MKIKRERERERVQRAGFDNSNNLSEREVKRERKRRKENVIGNLGAGEFWGFLVGVLESETGEK